MRVRILQIIALMQDCKSLREQIKGFSVGIINMDWEMTIFILLIREEMEWLCFRCTVSRRKQNI